MSDRLGVRFRVSGRVQGVNFRRAAMAAASALGLVGWVANRHDGAVEGYACGSAVALDEFTAWLRHGPAIARVDRVELEAAPVEDFAGFRIR